MDDQHVLALVETVDRADLHAVHILAAYASLCDDVGHEPLREREGSNRAQRSGDQAISE
jgi:hypothetical protein